MPVGILHWPTRMYTGDTIRRWVSCSGRFSERTRAHYSMVLWHFAHAVPSNLRHITVEHIERHIASILQKHTRRTCNAHLTAIKSFYRWASEHYDIPNIAAKVRMLKEDPPYQRVLSEEEYRSVLAVCSPVEADVIAFIANTGLRASEVQSLTWQNISRDRPLLTIIGKGRKRRTIPLNKTCLAILAKYPRKPNPSIDFLKSYTSRNALYALCLRLGRRASVFRFGPHALRHYFATGLMQKDVSITKISKILGHADTRTTELIYCHFRVADILGVTDVLD